MNLKISEVCVHFTMWQKTFQYVNDIFELIDHVGNNCSFFNLHCFLLFQYVHIFCKDVKAIHRFLKIQPMYLKQKYTGQN